MQRTYRVIMSLITETIISPLLPNPIKPEATVLSIMSFSLLNITCGKLPAGPPGSPLGPPCHLKPHQCNPFRLCQRFRVAFLRSCRELVSTYMTSVIPKDGATGTECCLLLALGSHTGPDAILQGKEG